MSSEKSIKIIKMLLKHPAISCYNSSAVVAKYSAYCSAICLDVRQQIGNKKSDSLYLMNNGNNQDTTRENSYANLFKEAFA